MSAGCKGVESFGKKGICIKQTNHMGRKFQQGGAYLSQYKVRRGKRWHSICIGLLPSYRRQLYGYERRLARVYCRKRYRKWIGHCAGKWTSHRPDGYGKRNETQAGTTYRVRWRLFGGKHSSRKIWELSRLYRKYLSNI